jgi:hypothetical protein
MCTPFYMQKYRRLVKEERRNLGENRGEEKLNKNNHSKQWQLMQAKRHCGEVAA